MMSLTITTPSILFPAISLLMLAYTNRFLALSQLIRSLYQNYEEDHSKNTLLQIKHLRQRVFLIRLMQTFGASAILFCTLSIFALLLKYENTGLYLFVISTLLFLGSITSSLVEILMSGKALDVLLSSIEKNQNKRN